jgi:hypothetical protein
LYDRYREAVWNGTITLSEEGAVQNVVPFGGLEDNTEDYSRLSGNHTVEFSSKTSGDIDGVNIALQDNSPPRKIFIAGSLGGYVKVGDALAGNPHKAQPNFQLETSWEEASRPDGTMVEILGGAELFVRVEAIPRVDLPQRTQGRASFSGQDTGLRSIYFVGREWSGEKVVTSPIFIDYV